MLRQSTITATAKITSRHIGKLLSFLESLDVDQKIINQVRKEIWFLHDDILDKVSEDED